MPAGESNMELIPQRRDATFSCSIRREPELIKPGSLISGMSAYFQVLLSGTQLSQLNEMLIGMFQFHMVVPGACGYDQVGNGKPFSVPSSSIR